MKVVFFSSALHRRHTGGPQSSLLGQSCGHFTVILALYCNPSLVVHTNCSYSTLIQPVNESIFRSVYIVHPSTFLRLSLHAFSLSRLPFCHYFLVCLFYHLLFMLKAFVIVHYRFLLNPIRLLNKDSLFAA